jgi:hypothetical protein
MQRLRLDMSSLQCRMERSDSRPRREAPPFSRDDQRVEGGALLRDATTVRDGAGIAMKLDAGIALSRTSAAGIA